MRKWINKHPYWVAVVLVCACLTMFAARPRGVSRMNSMWVASDTATPGDVTVDSFDGTYNGYVEGDLEVDGTIYSKAGGISGATTSRSETIPLATLFINGGAVVGADAVTAPGLATTDNIPKLVYASSGEASSIGYSFVLPDDYDSGLSFRMLVSSSSSTSPTLLAFSWLAYVNKDGVAFDATAYQQTKVNAVTACDTTNEVLDFTLGTTAEADLEAGNTVTVWFWPADTRTGTVTTEIGSLQKRYTATQ